jgi:hypothetical protein
MSGAVYQCCEQGRRAALLAGPATLTGIDFVEVFAGPTTLDPTTIVITLVKPIDLPLGELTAANFRLTGGVRLPAPPLSPVVTMAPGGGTVATYTLTVPGNNPVDFSLYQLAIVADAQSSAPPVFIDPRLSSVALNFKIGCASDSDCAPDCTATPAAAPDEVPFDYRNRDWPGFRQTMLDRLAALVPNFQSNDPPVDFTVTLLEALAAEADRLSYQLDWIGTEAFLGTARSRTSIARHARLVNYRPGEGVSARTFAQFGYTPAGAFSDGLVLPASTPLVPQQTAITPVIAAHAWPQIIATQPLVFETCAPLTLWSWRGEIAFYTWSDDECLLPAGATSATLVDGSGGGAAALAPGDLLLLIEVLSPITGLAGDASPQHRQVVRLTSVETVTDPLAPAKVLIDVGWDVADAPGFDLVIQARPTSAGSASATVHCAVAKGNVVLADHGLSLPPPDALGLVPYAREALRPQLDPPAPVAGLSWRPQLDRANLARTLPTPAPTLPASLMCNATAAQVLPALAIDDAFAVWTARADLLESDAYDRDFVVEPGMAGIAQLRFGDGIHGQVPSPASQFALSGRFGSGLIGNIGSDCLGHLVLSDAFAGAQITVHNPLPAQSGADPEPITSVRLNAPFAFRQQDRAVTAQDYASAALKHPQVEAAIAIPRWTGAFQTMLVYVDRAGGVAIDAAFVADVAAFLEHYRLMGIDVAVRAAVKVPLDIALSVCAVPGALQSTVAAQVRDALHPVRADGTAGFFDPARFTFGAPLMLSALTAAIMAIDSVQSVEVLTFQRFGRAAAGELAAGFIRSTGPEVLQLADDPDFPERGRLQIAAGGGR